MKVTLFIFQTVGIALLLSAASTSAGGTNATATSGGARALGTVDSIHLADSLSDARVSPLSAIAFAPLQPEDKDGEYRDHDSNWDHDHDRDWDHDHEHKPDRAPTPTPEPFTALLFGAAMLIGGGILRRKYRKSQS